MEIYHLIWHIYGSWLPGHEMGWMDRRSSEVQPGHEGLEKYARSVMVEEPVVLSMEQRRLVAEVVRKHCEIRG